MLARRFARQAQLLLRIGRVVDVALRSLAYVREALRDFERHGLGGSPAVHVWVFSVCVDLAEVCEVRTAPAARCGCPRAGVGAPTGGGTARCFCGAGNVHKRPGPRPHQVSAA
jgi:hypothetical protein